MLVKDGIAYLQAGVSSTNSCYYTAAKPLAKGGIVFDSDPYDEWMETINKLGAFVLLSVHNFPRQTAVR